MNITKELVEKFREEVSKSVANEYPNIHYIVFHKINAHLYILGFEQKIHGPIEIKKEEK